MVLVKVLVLIFKTVYVKLRCDLERFVYAGNRLSFFFSLFVVWNFLFLWLLFSFLRLNAQQDDGRKQRFEIDGAC